VENNKSFAEICMHGLCGNVHSYGNIPTKNCSQPDLFLNGKHAFCFPVPAFASQLNPYIRTE